LREDTRVIRTLSAIFAVALLAALAAAPAATAAPAIFIAPSFIRQWDPGPPTSNFQDAKAITVDPFGDVYVLRITGTSGAGSFQIQKYQEDGTHIAGPFDVPQTGFPAGGFATDPQGHLFVTVPGGPTSSHLREFTSGGGELGELNTPQLLGTAIAFDAAGHLYGNGYDAAHNPALNEYTVSGSTAQLINSTPYPGSPNTGFFPYNFFGLTTDDAGNVYASGKSTSSSFLAKYSPGLSSLTGYLESCPSSGDGCFGGFGLAFTNTGFTTGVTPTVYAGGGYGGGAASTNFYRMGIYRTAGDVPSVSSGDYLVSFGPAPVPSGAFANAPQVAASPCHAAIYILASVFGGPNGTFNGNEVQEFDTHAPATPCAVPAVSVVSGFEKSYKLKKPSNTSTPCVPCAVLLPSGAFAQASAASVASLGATVSKRRKKRRSGVLLRFNSSAAADVTFLVNKLPARKRHGKRHGVRKLGGFVYAAQPGQNSLRFSGVLRKGHQLRPGSYKVLVFGGGNKRRFHLTVVRTRRGKR
jgi:hypothetical protein